MMRGIVGGRVVKSAIATALAWEVGSLLPGGTAHPYFAPLAALLAMQVTVAASFNRAIERVAAVIGGVAVALLVTKIIGVSALGVGLLVGLALALGTRLRMSDQGTSQVAVSALLVLFVGAQADVSYAGSRILESLAGALVGLAVNMLLVPRSYLPEARTAVTAMVEEAASILEGLASGLQRGMSTTEAERYLQRARAQSEALAAARVALARADESLKFNLFGGAQRETLARSSALCAAMEHTVIQMRTIARALSDAANAAPLAPAVPPPLGEALGTLLAAIARVLRSSTGSDDPSAASGEGMEQPLAAAEAAHREMADLARSALADLDPGAALRAGALLATAQRMLADLATPGIGGGDPRPAGADSERA